MKQLSPFGFYFELAHNARTQTFVRSMGFNSHRLGGLSTLFFAFVAALFATCGSGFALDDPDTQLQKVGVTTKLGTPVDLGLQFTDSQGKSVALRDLIPHDRPAIIIPAYFGCPRLCGLVQAGVATLVNTVSFSLGKDYSIITVSFDPDDQPDDAASAAKKYQAMLSKEGIDPKAWHFVVGQEPNIEKLMGQLGFGYAKDGDEYAHTAAIFLITPDGTISQYLAGITFEPNTARHALVEASKGSIGGPLDQAFLFCFRYDHLTGKYVWFANDFMRVGGILTLSFLALLIYRLWYKERHLTSQGNN